MHTAHSGFECAVFFDRFLLRSSDILLCKLHLCAPALDEFSSASLTNEPNSLASPKRKQSGIFGCGSGPPHLLGKGVLPGIRKVGQSGFIPRADEFILNAASHASGKSAGHSGLIFTRFEQRFTISRAGSGFFRREEGGA